MDPRTEKILRKIIAVPSPAAGANFVFVSAGLGPLRILALTFTLTTSAAVANRAVSLEVDDATDTVYRLPAGSVQTTGLTGRYGAAEGVSAGVAVGLVWPIPLPGDGLTLDQGWRLRSVVDNIDVADQLGAIRLYVEEYPSGGFVGTEPVEPFIVERLSVA